MRIGIITLIIITLLPQIVGATDNIQGEMNQLIKQADPNLNIGIKITNLHQGKVIFEKNVDRYFIPASTLKFITIVAILEHFGTNYNFTSELLHKNQDYYLNIHDPDFGVEDLAYLVSELAKYSSKNIKGNI
jgi:D-alanyl-D-alanine carboxypeptidase/D-alanyl-D-alanine-endopeptidase (penicillin-binding protein 4)